MKNLDLLIPASGDRDSSRWATVTQASPLRIRLDGESDPLPFTPDTLVSGLSVSDRVYVLFAGNADPARAGRRVVVLGRAGGGGGGGVPPGVVAPYAGSAAPAGWLLCDGSAVSRTTYAGLFAVIGTTYGSGDGSTTFNLPDLRGRVPVGRDASQSEFDTLGEAGGAKTHTLTTAEMPQHNHSVSLTTSTNGLHQHPIGADNVASGSGRIGMHVPGNQTGTAGNNQTGTYFEGDHTHTVSGNTGNAGSGNAHNNLQPYVVLNYIIKT